MDPVQSMPAHDALTKNAYGSREWLTYYKNLWGRNVIARTIDVKTDEALKKEDPELIVTGEQGQPIPVKERLEHRKILVHDALELLKAVDELMAIPEADFAKLVWSDEALAVAPDMMPKVEEPGLKAGDACKSSDGKDGILKSDGKGGLVCEVAEAPGAAAPAEAAAASAEAKPEAPSDEAKV